MKIDRKETIAYLTDLQFIGSFPGGIEVLLVPFKTAFEEMNLLEPEFTEAKLKNYLKISNIQVFSSSEDWAKFKGLEKRKRNR